MSDKSDKRAAYSGSSAHDVIISDPGNKVARGSAQGSSSNTSLTSGNSTRQTGSDKPRPNPLLKTSDLNPATSAFTPSPTALTFNSHVALQV